MSKGVSATFRHRLGATVSVELSPELVAKLKVDEEEFSKLLTEAVEALAAYMIVAVAAEDLALEALNLLLANVAIRGISIMDLAESLAERSVAH